MRDWLSAISEYPGEFVMLSVSLVALLGVLSSVAGALRGGILIQSNKVVSSEVKK